MQALVKGGFSMSLSKRMIQYLSGTGITIYYQDQNLMPTALNSTDIHLEEGRIFIRLNPVQLAFLGKHRNADGIFSVEPILHGTSRAPFSFSGVGMLTGSVLLISVGSVIGCVPSEEEGRRESLYDERYEWARRPA